MPTLSMKFPETLAAMTIAVKSAVFRRRSSRGGAVQVATTPADAPWPGAISHQTDTLYPSRGGRRLVPGTSVVQHVGHGRHGTAARLQILDERRLRGIEEVIQQVSNGDAAQCLAAHGGRVDERPAHFAARHHAFAQQAIE